MPAPYSSFDTTPSLLVSKIAKSLSASVGAGVGSEGSATGSATGSVGVEVPFSSVGLTSLWPLAILWDRQLGFADPPVLAAWFLQATLLVAWV